MKITTDGKLIEMDLCVGFSDLNEDYITIKSDIENHNQISICDSENEEMMCMDIDDLIDILKIFKEVNKSHNPE